MQWIIEAAIKSDIFGFVFVSTDSPEIMELVKSVAGVTVTPRPEHLAGDDVRAEEVFKYVVETVAETLSYKPEIVCMAMPTAPFTTPESLRGAYEELSSGDPFSFSAMALCVKTDHNTHRTLYRHSEGGAAHPVSGGWGTTGMQSQNLPITFRPTYGGMFVRTEKLLTLAPSYYGDPQGIYEVEYPEGIDIDTEDDWQQAERYLSERLQKEPV